MSLVGRALRGELAKGGIIVWWVGMFLSPGGEVGEGGGVEDESGG